MGNKKTSLLCIFVLFVVITAIFLSRFFNDYSKISLLKNNKEIFNVKDLTLDKLDYISKEEDVEKLYGKPNNTKSFDRNGIKYKINKYDGLEITLKEYYDTYKISKVVVTSKKYNVSRNIKVGYRIVKIMNKFYILNKKGSYMYGNYSSDSLENETISDNIIYGKRTKNTVEYINRDKKLSDNIDMPTNISKLIINYKNGKVTKIMWSYDVE